MPAAGFLLLGHTSRLIAPSDRLGPHAKPLSPARTYAKRA
jgi:hypothetical protein